jgi:hypothetical protein
VPRQKKPRKTYSTGDLNKLIDGLVHPLSKTNAGFILLDGFLHGLVEKNPPETVRKFLRYSLPELVKQIEKSSQGQD